MEENKQILIAITELKANVKHMSDQLKEIGKMGQSVVEATQSVKSAHNRIDDVKEDYEKKLKSQKEDYESKIAAESKAREKIESNITWLWRSVAGGLIGFIFTMIMYFMNGGG